MLTGTLHNKLDSFSEAENALKQAYFMAQQSHHSLIACRASTQLIGVLGKREPTRSLEWARHARAALDRGCSMTIEAEYENTLGLQLYDQGEYELARQHLDRVLDLQHDGADLPPDLIANNLNNLGLLLRAQGKGHAAIEYHKQSLEIRRELYGPSHPTFALSLNNLAAALYQQGDLKGAEETTRQALTIREVALGPDHQSVLVTLNNLGVIVGAQGRFKQAEALHRRVVSVLESRENNDLPFLAQMLNELGHMLHKQGRLDETLALQKRALSILEDITDSVPSSRESHALCLRDLGTTLGKLGRTDEAMQAYQRALELLEHLDTPGSLVRVLNSMASIHLRRGQLEQALPYAQRSVAMLESGHEGGFQAIWAHFILAQVLWRSDRDRAQALQLAHRALKIEAVRPDKETHRLLKDIRAWIARHDRNGRRSE